MNVPALDVRGLRVAFGGGIDLVSGVDIRVEPGRFVALVGPSGSGKSTVALACLRLLDERLAMTSWDALAIAGRELTALTPTELRRVRGRLVGSVFQDPHGSLNPVFSALFQVVEALRVHQPLSQRDAERRALTLLDELGVDRETAVRHPHELSGGQKQRVGLAIALANDPPLLIADEPTSALDVVVQAQLLDLLRVCRTRRDTAILFVTHDLALVRGFADEVLVMDAGRIVERGPPGQLLAAPVHPRTQALVGARLPVRPPPPKPTEPPLLEVRNLSVDLAAGTRHRMRVLADISFDVHIGRTLAVVGGSGSGKTSLARAVLRLVEPTTGTGQFGGIDVRGLAKEPLRAWRRQAQLIFQDPGGSLDPRMSVADSLNEPMAAHGLGSSESDRAERVAALLDEVGLDATFSNRLPHTLSGGQRQRVAIARALALDPRLLICDEVVSALDTESRTQILTLLRQVQARRGVAYLFISHDLGVVRHFADDVAVLEAGRLVELGPTEAVLGAPRSSAGRALVAASTHLT